MSEDMWETLKSTGRRFSGSMRPITFAFGSIEDAISDEERG